MAVRDPLAPTDAMRVQLEGRLEVVEQLLAGWESAASVLADDSALVSDSWHGLVTADAEAVSAVDALRARAGDADERLVALARARAQVAFTVHARLRALGIACSSTDAIAALETLKYLQPLTFARLDCPAPEAQSREWSMLRSVFIAVMLMVLIASIGVRPLALSAVATLALSAALLLRPRASAVTRRPTLVVLTRHALLVRDQTIVLNEVNAVQYRTLPGGALELRLPRGERAPFRLVVHDPGQLLLGGLRQRGVKVSPRWTKERSR